MIGCCNKPREVTSSVSDVIRSTIDTVNHSNCTPFSTSRSILIFWFHEGIVHVDVIRSGENQFVGYSAANLIEYFIIKIIVEAILKKI